MLNTPAFRALLIQLASLFVVLLISAMLPAHDGFHLTVLSAALLQGAIAVVLAWAIGMASWWLLIHAAFAPLAMLLLAVALPPWVYLVLFVATITLYWQAFRTQVPFYPSTAPVWRAVAELLPPSPTLRFVDVGSGFGGLVMHLATTRGAGNFSGIELAPLPWLCSVVRARFSRSAASFVRGDYEELDFSRFDVVFAYLSPAAMPALWRKANAEMQPGSLLLSYEFAVPGVAPHMSVRPRKDGALLYGWRF